MHRVNRWVTAMWDADLEPTSKLIALYLRSHMNEAKHRAWPSVETIGKKCGIKSVRTVQAHLQKLVAAGCLIEDVKKSKVRTKIYHINFPNIAPADIAPADIAPLPPQILTSIPANIAPELNKGTKQVIKQPEENTILFELFWNSGLTKKGSKSKTEKYFSELLEEQSNPTEFTNDLVLDIASRRAAGQFGFDKLYPRTYLKGERWKDEHDEVSELDDDYEPREVVF